MSKKYPLARKEFILFGMEIEAGNGIAYSKEDNLERRPLIFNKNIIGA